MHELNQTEIKALAALFEGSRSVKKISEKIGRSSTRTSVILNNLEKKGFLNLERNGLSLEVSSSSQRFMNAFKLMMHSGIPDLNVLTDSRMTVLSYFLITKDPLQKRHLLIATGLSNSSLRDILHYLVRAGVLRRNGRSYSLSRSMELLESFLQGYSDHITWIQTKELPNDLIINWKNGFEFICSSTEDIDLGEITAISGFTENGVEIQTNRIYKKYIPGKRIVGIEDHIIDALLISNAKGHNLMYSCIYLKRHSEAFDLLKLLDLSYIYGFEDTIRKMLDFTTGKKKEIDGFPSYKEFNSKYSLYRG